jgi:hypothetical protein
VIAERNHIHPITPEMAFGTNIPECDLEDLKALNITRPVAKETKKVEMRAPPRPRFTPPPVQIHVHEEKWEHEEPIIIERPVYIEKPVYIEVPSHRDPPHVRPVSLNLPTPPPRERIAKTPLVVEPFVERPVPRDEVFVAPIRVPQAHFHAPEPIIEAPVFQRPVTIEFPHERPYIVEEPMFYEPAIEPIHFERPMIELNINPNNPGIIFGIDEEVDIERCFYEEIENWSSPEYAEVVEEAVVNTPYGPKVVRSPAVPHLARPPIEHDEILRRCMHKILIAPTMEVGIKIPQVRYVTIQQVQTGTFEWPIIRRAQIFPQKTLEKTVEIPQLGFVDLCQDHPTNETAVSIPQVHTVFIEQIVKTNECTVSIPIVHTIWVPIMGDVNIVQHRTKSRRVFLRQEWDCTIKCEDTRVHFIKIPQKDVGVTGTVIKNINDENANICYNCHNSKWAGVGPAFNPFLFEKSAPVVATVAAPVLAPEPEIIFVEVPAAAPEPIIKYETIVQDPTYIHHIQLGMCPCAAVAVTQPVGFLEIAPAAAGWPWWYWLLLGLLLLCLLWCLAGLLWWCCCRKKEEKPEPAVVAESPKKKYYIQKKTKEEDEEEIEREIARQLEQRVQSNKREKTATRVEEEKKVDVRTEAKAGAESKVITGTELTQQQKETAQGKAVVAGATAGSATAVAAAQDRGESPGGSHRSSGRRGSSKGSGSSKRVVKKRIVKMMKQGKLVAEKEEILDEEGNVIRVEIRKEGLNQSSPNRSQP